MASRPGARLEDARLRRATEGSLLTLARGARASGVARELVHVVAGRALSVGSLLGVSVLVARAVGPAEYGLYAAALSLALLLDGVIGGPFDNATVRFGSLHRAEPERVARMVAAAVRLRLGVGVLVGLALLLGGGRLAGLLFRAPGRTTLLAVAVGSTLALLAYRGIAAALQVRLRFEEYARLDALQGALRLAGALVLVLLGAGAAEPFLGLHGGVAALAVVVAGRSVPGLQGRAGWPEPGDLRALVSYSGITAAAVVLGTVTARADVVVLAAARPASEVGQYGAALQLSVIATLVATFAGIVVQPRIIPLARQGRLSAVLGWSLCLGVVVGVPLTMAVVWLCPWVVPLVFGAAYAPAVPILQVLLLATFLDLLGIPVLLPTAVQLFPRAALAAELATTAGVLVAAPMIAATGGPVGMAWLVVAIRVAKLALYLAIAVSGLRAVREPGRLFGAEGSQPVDAGVTP